MREQEKTQKKNQNIQKKRKNNKIVTFLAMSNKKAKRRRAKRRRSRLKIKKKVLVGVARIHTTFTNYIITMTDLKGNALCWSSSGQCGFKGKKKRSHYAGKAIGRNLGFKAKQQRKMIRVIAILRGIGRGRLNVVRGLGRSGLEVLRIVDRTPRAFNGCRPRKRRRV